MSELATDEGMQNLVGELLYKNQLLRTAVKMKDDCLSRIAQIIVSREMPACTCEAERQLTCVHLVLSEKHWNQEIGPAATNDPSS